MSGRSFSEDLTSNRNRNLSYQMAERHLSYQMAERHRHESYEDEMQNRQRSQQLDQVQTFAGWAVGLSSGILAEHILSHPFIVLRRQCQVHYNGQWYHLTPFTLFPVMVSLQKQQGLGTLWKGISSVFLSKGIFMASETLISEVTPFPKEISRHHSLSRHAQHLALKLMAYVITTPFWTSSFLETVQSDISSERPGVFDCLKEGVSRLMNWGMPQTTRLLPIWQLIPPTVFVGVSSYMIIQLAKYTVLTTIRLEEQEIRNDAREVDEQAVVQQSMYDRHFPDLLANFTGSLIAELMMFPFETVLHRLYLQGTRTIIDNMDTGLDVVPIGTDYAGVIDCFKQIISEEGLSGLYRGFGALVLQYMIHGMIIKIAKYFFEKFSDDHAARHSRRFKNR